jgi:hypothetical protein
VRCERPEAGGCSPCSVSLSAMALLIVFEDNAGLLPRAQAGRGVGQDLLRPHGVDVAQGDCGKLCRILKTRWIRSYRIPRPHSRVDTP